MCFKTAGSLGLLAPFIGGKAVGNFADYFLQFISNMEYFGSIQARYWLYVIKRDMKKCGISADMASNRSNCKECIKPVVQQMDSNLLHSG